MPDQNNQPLPPIEEEAFKHGDKYSAEINHKPCLHKDVQFVSALEIKCPTCQAGWTGQGIKTLFEAIKSQ